MGVRNLLRKVDKAARLPANEEEHERTDSWSNRDLIPLPPQRRTWETFDYYGYWSLGSLNVAAWQAPSSFLTEGLSVGQTMAVILIGRTIVGIFSTFIAWCGLRWHIGFTIQNRFTWGMRGSYIPLLQRVLLNFIWNANQCWTGGKLVAVCITAVFPSFQNLNHKQLPGNTPATVTEMLGFFLFWFFSIPFLWLPPERFRIPFLVTCVYCGTAMIAMLIWSLAVAQGVGPVFYKGSTIPSTSTSWFWSTSWIMLKCINSTIGGKAAGMTNGSDFSRYAKSPRQARRYIIGTITCLVGTGTMVSFIGLVVTAAAQKIYGTIYWNPPDLLLRMMQEEDGSIVSSKARAGVFFLAMGFAFTSGFENICGNAVAGGIDLAGIFPKYINIRRGAIITFFAAWIVQPWQLINRAATFVTVLSSFTVFLAPLMGMMTCDYFVIRKQKIKLTWLYELRGGYFYHHGMNWRCLPVWIAGWAPTVGGLSVTVQGKKLEPKPLYEMYYISFFLGFFISFILFYAVNRIFPPTNVGQIDDTDTFGAFTPEEAKRLGVAPSESPSRVTAESGSLDEKLGGSDIVSVQVPGVAKKDD
ncbi:hypothetical protein V5O48_004017 [Marasmius crinis-equi]|uniref:Uncharacterized protein n=1 Tax=Marasmius crinis-equi TaxID=585013 RepID=A0ABR3FR82_9AGAR